MMNFQTEERAKLKKHWVDQAIALAMQNKWEEAVNVNQTILDLYPNDVDAYNRLGRALTEMGRFREARDAYSRAVAIDPLNAIAQKNLARLSAVSVETAPRPVREKVDARFFIAETGKTGVATLVRAAGRELLAKMAVGDQVYLHPEGRVLYVRNARGENLGQVEPRLSQRLIDLMKGGNQYAAALMSVENGTVRIIIRETYQDPSQAGKVSFPTRGEAAAVRPYIRETILRYEAEEEEEEGAEGVELEGAETEDLTEATEFEEERGGE